jgi:Leucine-rich repeat (LRR) protein
MAEFTKEQQYEAYRAAEEAIEAAFAKGWTVLDLSARRIDRSRSGIRFADSEYAALTHIPPQLATLTDLKSLMLSQTQVRNITPLSALTGLQDLRLDNTRVNDLTPLAALTSLQTLLLSQTDVTDIAPLAALTGLQTLTLSQTQVSDIAPLAALTGLRTLFISETPISDVGPLAALIRLQHLRLFQATVTDLIPLTALTDLQDLSLSGSAVRDLRPLLPLTRLGTHGIPGLTFDDTPATRADATLHELSQIEDPQERTEKTLAYLATLPPWPEPLDPAPADTQILTVEAVLKTQSPLGWRFSPSHGAMEVYAEAVATTAMQEQLAKMSRDRVQTLKYALTGANHGLRGEARLEADRFAALLEDGSRPLSVRSVELWGSLVALGGILDGNDAGRAQGRDPLDLLSVEQRAALQTLLQIAGNLVRSFADVKALDDSAGGFLRRSISVDMVLAMIEAALRARYVAPASAALMQHVAVVGRADGPQADKATNVSVRGVGNLIQTAALIVGKGSLKLAGAAAVGAAGYVGAQAADHYDLDKAAFAYFDEIGELVEPFLANMAPDEAAVLNAALNDARARLNERARLATSADAQSPEQEQARRHDDQP